MAVPPLRLAPAQMLDREWQGGQFTARRSGEGTRTDLAPLSLDGRGGQRTARMHFTFLGFLS